MLTLLDRLTEEAAGYQAGLDPDFWLLDAEADVFLMRLRGADSAPPQMFVRDKRPYRAALPRSTTPAQRVAARVREWKLHLEEKRAREAARAAAREAAERERQQRTRVAIAWAEPLPAMPLIERERAALAAGAGTRYFVDLFGALAREIEQRFQMWNPPGYRLAALLGSYRKHLATFAPEPGPMRVAPAEVEAAAVAQMLRSEGLAAITEILRDRAGDDEVSREMVAVMADRFDRIAAAITEHLAEIARHLDGLGLGGGGGAATGARGSNAA